MSKSNLTPKTVMRSDGIFTTVHVKDDGSKTTRKLPSIRSAAEQDDFDANATHSENSIERTYETLTTLPLLDDIVKVTHSSDLVNGTVEGRVTYVGSTNYIEVEGWGVFITDEIVVEKAIDAVARVYPDGTLYSEYGQWQIDDDYAAAAGADFSYNLEGYILPNDALITSFSYPGRGYTYSVYPPGKNRNTVDFTPERFGTLRAAIDAASEQ